MNPTNLTADQVKPGDKIVLVYTGRGDRCFGIEVPWPVGTVLTAKNARKGDGYNVLTVLEDNKHYNIRRFELQSRKRAMARKLIEQ